MAERSSTVATQRPPDAPSLRTAITLLKAALETAPNPRVSDGPPSYWAWYDGVRANTLDLTKDL